MEFNVQQAVLDIGVKIVYAKIEGVDNTQVSPEWMAYRTAEIARLLEKYRDLDLKADPVLESFNVLHDRSGVKRRKNIPSAENLIKLLIKHGDMFFISQAVDIYNLISLQSKLALGAHDLDKVDGDITLRFTDGTERYVPIGQTAPVPVAPGEYCYCDDANEVLCRLEIRQVEKDKVTEATSRIGYIIQGSTETSWEFLQQVAQEIVDTTVKYCGGSGEVVMPTII